MMAYLLSHVFPAFNFALLLVVLFVLQHRTARFQRIEDRLAELESDLAAREVQRLHIEQRQAEQARTHE